MPWALSIFLQIIITIIIIIIFISITNSNSSNSIINSSNQKNLSLQQIRWPEENKESN